MSEYPSDELVWLKAIELGRRRRYFSEPKELQLPPSVKTSSFDVTTSMSKIKVGGSSISYPVVMTGLVSQERLNPAPKPLGSNIQVVPVFRVDSDPNLLQDQDSVLECLGPLLDGSGSVGNKMVSPPRSEKMTITHALSCQRSSFPCSSPTSPATKKKRRLHSSTFISNNVDADPATAAAAAATWSRINAVLLKQNDEPSSAVTTTAEGTSSSGEEEEQGRMRDPNNNSSSNKPVGLTDHQAALWETRFRELVEYQQRFGHCLVPHKWPENRSLATWVKRQRYQWKLREQGKRSTITEARLDALSNLGFVWDSHNATWEERFNELVEYKRVNGHASVPSTDKNNHSLSVWVQCQRRQWKLMKEEQEQQQQQQQPLIPVQVNSSSNDLMSVAAGYRMKQNRIERLESIGFVWEPRRQKHEDGGGIVK